MSKKKTKEIHSFIWHQGDERCNDPDSYEMGYVDCLMDNLGKNCHLIPFDVDGTIMSVWLKMGGIFYYEVRYFMDGKINTEYFLDEEIKVK